jgi:hypothetical protein
MEPGEFAELLRLDMERRFEAVDQHFTAILAEMCQNREQAERRSQELAMYLSALGLCSGKSLEQVSREVVEKFSGQTFTTAERLVLSATAGTVFGVPEAQVEFDLYAANGTAYLIEVKFHVEPGDVLTFHRKADFAVQTLHHPSTRLIIALSIEEQGELLMQRLSIHYRVRTRVE